MIDPKSVLVTIPADDGKVLAELAGSLIMSSNLFGGISIKSEVSLVPLVRNILAHQFLHSPMNFQWMICIDADIGFTPQDFKFLLQPHDNGHMAYGEPEPTKVDGYDELVTAEVAAKTDEHDILKLGMGFVRIHRRVFEKLQGLTHEDGAGRLWQFHHQGKMCHDYFPCGPLVSQVIPSGQWLGEDRGFYALCQLAGIIPRIERRTHLVHFGRKGYHYQREPSLIERQIADGGEQHFETTE